MKKVVINASGGGSDTGATGNGITEKDYTLRIANEIKDILTKNGVDVLMLRDGDETISYDDRVKKIKDKYGDATDIILLSNTLNSGGESGIEVIYPLNKNDTLAKSIVNNLEYFNDVNYYQYRWPTDTSKDYYYITRITPNYETLIIRYGYVDNSKDANIIKNDYKKMAEAVSEAVLDYLGVFTDEVYIVKSGDTLYSIANKYNTTVDDIKKLNGLTSNNLSIGQRLKIPESSNTSSSSSNESYYVVKSGDTLYAIANKYNTTVDEIKKLNGLTSNNLSIGQTLKIPGKNNNTTTTSNESYYTVVSGDTLYSIANKFGTTVDKLKELNNLSSSLINVGMSLKVTGNQTYKVVSGDTLYGIAKKFNTTVDKIKQLNNLKSDLIDVGTILSIP